MGWEAIHSNSRVESWVSSSESRLRCCCLPPQALRRLIITGITIITPIIIGRIKAISRGLALSAVRASVRS